VPRSLSSGSRINSSYRFAPASIRDGKPAAYVQIGKQFVVRPIQVGRRNDEDIIVTSGLKEGETVTLESPADAAKRAKKKL